MADREPEPVQPHTVQSQPAHMHPVQTIVEPDARSWLLNLLLVVAAVLQLARVAQVQSADGESPFLSANDRSRWCTVASLAINGSYEIDDVIELRSPNKNRRSWYTIDMVRHRGADGRQHYYSSKPPLLATLIAGVYSGMRAITGSSLMNDLFFTVRWLLVLVNLVPLFFAWWMLARWMRDEVRSDWAAVLLALFIGFGTFLSTFSNTLNNHLPAALAVGLSLWCIDRIALRNDPRWGWFALCGLATSFGAANELPALSWVAAAGCILAIVDLRRALFAYVPALLPVAIAFFATNFMAHGEWKPAYAHRSLGDQLFEMELAANADVPNIDVQSLVESLNTLGLEVSDSLIVRAARRPDVWEAWDETTEQRFGLQRTAAERVGVYRWGDWYDYPQSYWLEGRKQGVDRGEPSRALYMFHCLVGHHGIFSLTPFWLLSLLGAVCVWHSRSTRNMLPDHRLLIAAAIVATSVVAVGFYLTRPLEDRNYGGVCSGFRWAFWLTIPWIWLAAQGLERIHGGWARRVTESLLAFSIFSATFPWSNPWTSPWLMRYWEYLGWV